MWPLLGPDTKRDGTGALCATQGIFYGYLVETHRSACGMYWGGPLQLGWERGPSDYVRALIQRASNPKAFLECLGRG